MLNDNQVAVGPFNSTHGVDTMPLSLQRNDTINNSFNWYNKKEYLAVGQSSASSFGGGSGFSQAFNSADTAFIGVRIFKAPDTVYGWIRVANVGAGCLIIDFASGGPPNKIKDSTINTKVRIYPNPSNGIFIIQSPDIIHQSTVEVYNVLGEKIYNAAINKNDLKIDLTASPPGIYLCLIHTDSGDLALKRKLIIQK